MNQILFNNKSQKKIKLLYIIQLILYISFICLYLFNKYNIKRNDIKLINATSKSYQLLHLYSNTSQKTEFLAKDKKISILGTIAIPKIDIEYSILSDYSDDLLKISVCKFYGPNINSIGNFCILGHNYNNDIFFSKYYLLNIGDKINIYSLNSAVTIYTIYDIYEVSPDDLSYISQQTFR